MSSKAKVRQIRVCLVRSPIGARPNQRRTVRALGLRRLNSAVVRAATPTILGMVRTVSHLVRVEEVE
jgi:large subunit ribosomal protein L30